MSLDPALELLGERRGYTVVRTADPLALLGRALPRACAVIVLAGDREPVWSGCRVRRALFGFGPDHVDVDYVVASDLLVGRADWLRAAALTARP